MDASRSFTRKHEPLCSSPSSSNNWSEALVKRRKVQQTLEEFRSLFRKLMCEYKADQPWNLKAKTKALMQAAMVMKNKSQWENTQKRVGHVTGIEVGDRFQSRAELNIIGLHRQFSSGIDYIGKGSNSLATSVVVTDRYDNSRKSNTTLVYIGQGGNPNVKRNVPLQDQKLEGGNLALKNSMDAKSPVRVILKDYGKSDGMDTYVYDALYLVEKMTQGRGKFGKLVFKFTLSRILEQSKTCVAIKDDDVMDNNNNSGLYASFDSIKRHKTRGCGIQKDVVRSNDISKGKEKIPIRVVTSVDCFQTPPPFDYIVNNMYSGKFKQPNLCGCDCTDGCVDYKKCACIVKNGGTIPYDCNKKLASLNESRLIHECGPSCECSSSCINRVSQHGIQFQLEIFNTELKGWGVRTRSFIPVGSFVCEYIGEVCSGAEARSRLDDDYILNMGMFVMDTISSLDFSQQSWYAFAGVGKGFIDATVRGNVGRFVNHSCSPNLLVKDVMYDHSDMSLPHKMLFAAKDIPAGRELSYDYNSCRGKFIKFRSNSCHCGSRECRGKIYI